MAEAVYLETTFISYLVARDTIDVVRQGQQQITRQWWRDRRSAFELFSSQFVIDESSAGDSSAAAERLAVLAAIDLLAITPEVVPLAQRLLAAGALPPKARLDALHIAVAAVNGMQYLLTWNCRHLANAALRPTIEHTCSAAGFQPPLICTPYELLGDSQ
jgi:hypothetical protein